MGLSNDFSLDISGLSVYNWFVDLGDWSNGMTRVSKTFSGGSIPSSPVPKGSRNASFFYYICIELLMISSKYKYSKYR